MSARERGAELEARYCKQTAELRTQMNEHIETLQAQLQVKVPGVNLSMRCCINVDQCLFFDSSLVYQFKIDLYGADNVLGFSGIFLKSRKVENHNV